MINPNNQFKQFLSQFYSTETDLNQLVRWCEVVEFKKGSCIMDAGAKQNAIFFICKGFVRKYFTTNDGQVMTAGFRMENMICSGYSYYNSTEDYKAKFSVECLEDCKMIKIPHSMIHYIENNGSNCDKFGKVLAENHLLELVDFIYDKENKTILERYYNLDIKFPGILQRVPQCILATYLGITPEYLSRVKNTKIAS
jgi:CRP/FNR family transcriptional regulator, anaerobic regulatory protein